MSLTRGASLNRTDLDAGLAENLWRIPEHCRVGLAQYISYGYAPGHFLRAVLSNDLAEACGRADEANRIALFDYVYLLTNYAPSAAWGSSDKVEAWIQRGVDLRLREASEVSP